MSKLYICVGENEKDGFSMGQCGDVKTLEKWIVFLFGEKGIDFFKGETESFILKYIKENAGKRLLVRK